MTLPSLLFGVILAALYAVAFHFWKANSLKKLLLYIVLSQLGFWVGHAIGGVIGWTFVAIGPINTGMATLGSAVFLFVGRWLSRVEIERD